MAAPTTTRAYTLRLFGLDDAPWRRALWNTHRIVNRGARVWGDWLLTLRGGLPPSLAEEDPQRRVLLALSWLSVETRKDSVPESDWVALGTDSAEDRSRKVLDRLLAILAEWNVPAPADWVAQSLPALSARIRRDAGWVDRFARFRALAERTGITPSGTAGVVLDLLGGEEEYFAMPADDSRASKEAKDFVIKAGNWLSANWGSGAKSDPGGIAGRLETLAAVPSSAIAGASGRVALARLCQVVASDPGDDADVQELLTGVKKAVGWKGRSSKGAVALERLAGADVVTEDLWAEVRRKLSEEAAAQQSKAGVQGGKPGWVDAMRQEIEQRIGMPFRTQKDHIWEYAVMLDHALRRVSAGHSWIKRAEASRREFQENAQRIIQVPDAARDWLDRYCEVRREESGTGEPYVVRRRAVDGWDDVVRSWSRAACRTRDDRRAAVKELQADAESGGPGDVQLFAGRDDDEDCPSLADDDATCVWQRAGKADPEILKCYVAARNAEFDQRRFKVPAYCHPDPLRHPVFADFGNSRWGIAYSALKAVQHQAGLRKKLAQAKTDATRAKIAQHLDVAPDLRRVTLGLWNGSAVDDVSLAWRGARLEKDLDIEHILQAGPDVSRGDRLGRAVAREPRGAVQICEAFAQKEWNGRLQAPRRELEKLAKRLEKHDFDVDRPEEWDEQARSLWGHLRWFLTFSPKLRSAGPWLDYVDAGLPPGWEYRRGRDGYYLWCEANQGRKGRAWLRLARLPGLRLLSVDLGERYAAACAVWQTCSRQEVVDGRCAAGQEPPGEDDLYVVLERSTGKAQRRRGKDVPVVARTLYRRIAADSLPDGSPHPAPWAKLDRQFLIKLQGEDRSARPPRSEETACVHEFRDWLGLKDASERSARDRKCVAVDKLMRDCVRLARLGLRRLGNCARIGYALTALKKPISGGRWVDLTGESRVKYIEDALLFWQELANSSEWRDDWARRQWDEWVVGKFGGPVPVEISADAPRPDRKQHAEQSRLALRPVAERLAGRDNADLHESWKAEWDRRADEWKSRLRWLRRWILGRGRGKGDPSVRRVGGLGYTRLGAIRGLYEVLKSFHMRPEPDDLRKNVPEPGDDSLAGFGRRILNGLERMRENRVKQLASRIVEAALGVGSQDRAHWEGGRRRPRQPIDDPRFAPCHAVVVEDLEHYRPDQVRSRRENRGLMNWTARNVRKFVIEGCGLHGLYFEEVPAAYTSRQDSRTGAPGVCCADVSVTDFLSWRWRREVSKARKKTGEGKGAARDRYLVALHDKWSDKEEVERRHAKPLRIPVKAGDLFVSADQESPAANGAQRDLNAAANIGLKAVLDPDWPGAWWYVRVHGRTYVPVKDSTAGSTAIPHGRALGQRPGEGADEKPVNRWSDVSPCALDSRAWASYTEYWNRVESRVVQILNLHAGLTTEQPGQPLEDDTPF